VGGFGPFGETPGQAGGVAISSGRPSRQQGDSASLSSSAYSGERGAQKLRRSETSRIMTRARSNRLLRRACTYTGRGRTGRMSVIDPKRTLRLTSDSASVLSRQAYI